VTNAIADISGLQFVLTKLIALNTSASARLSIQHDTSLVWQEMLETLPPLPKRMAPVPRGKPPSNVTVLSPGSSLPARGHNHENSGLYAVWPFRQFGVEKPDLPLALDTYAHRPHPCNHNWCQDIADAALLNSSAIDIANQIQQRALAPPARDQDGTLWRFEGFSQHYEDYAPAVDHISMLRIAMHLTLLQPLDDAAQSILLFPSWPVQLWDVSFKLHGPLNTTIEAACVGGKLVKLVVQPAERKGAVKVLNCRA
jgi:hypothetical protein